MSYRITRLENKLGVEETFSLKASMDSHFEMSKGHQSFNKPWAMLRFCRRARQS